MSDELSNFTLRLPEEMRKRLQTQADDKRRTLSAHILRILDIHLLRSGFGPLTIKTPAGREFEIEIEHAHTSMDETTCVFKLNELKFDKQRAYYLIGVDRDVLEDWHVADGVAVVKEVGVALLHFHTSTKEIDCLKWNQPGNAPDFDGRRILRATDTQSATVGQFLDRLNQGNWSDRFVELTEQSQDIRRGRTLAALYQ
jgi:hypothetical protein